MYEKVLEQLVKSGIDPIIAESMAKSLTKPKKEKKKKGWHRGPSRMKIKMEIQATIRCVTCGTITTVPRIVEAYEDSEPTQESIVGICPHCIKDFYEMTKEELISLIVIQNHTDLDLRQLSLKQQIRMSKRHKPQELYHKLY